MRAREKKVGLPTFFFIFEYEHLQRNINLRGREATEINTSYISMGCFFFYFSYFNSIALYIPIQISFGMFLFNQNI